MSSELFRVDESIRARLGTATMASLNCIACAMLGPSPTQRSARFWNSDVRRAGVGISGSFAGSEFGCRKRSNENSQGFEQQGGCWLSSSSSSRSRNDSVGCPELRHPARGLWFGNSLAEKSFHPLKLEGRFVVRANSSRRNFMFLLGDDSGYEEGPIELPPRELEINPLAFPEASPLQIVASFVLTGTIGVLLLRSLRRRAQRAKDMKFRSTGVATKESIKEDARKAALAKLTQAPEVTVAPPSPLQTFLGAAVAGVIAVLLYRVTTTVEGSFLGKPVSMNYSIRNLTITVRTIINGMLYLATFVFAANSIGLALYSIQLLVGDDSSPEPPLPDPLDKQEPSADTEKSSEAEDAN